MPTGWVVMGKPGTPMLFLPPLPPRQLPAQGCFVVGRSRGCDLTLKTPDASRRHAEIAAVTAGYLIRDLGNDLKGDRMEGYRWGTTRWTPPEPR